MEQFQYIAQTKQGAIERGLIDSASPAAARESLTQRGFRVLNVQASQARQASRSPWQTTWTWPTMSMRGAIRASELELTLRQLAVMLESGMAVLDALTEIAQHSSLPRQRRLCSQLAKAIESGDPLSEAFRRCDGVPTLVIRLTTVGEETGHLAVTLQRSADFLQRRRETLGNLLAAVSYPFIVAMAAIAVAVYLVGWAIPKLGVFLDAMGRKMPPMTQSLLNLSAAFQTYGVGILITSVAAAVGLGCFLAWAPGRMMFDRWVLRVPLFGVIIRMAETQQLASALALMLRNGVFLPEALEVSATLHRNRYLAARVRDARKQLDAGRELATTLGGFGFAEMLTSMVAIGERSGNLTQVLEHVAEFYAGQVTRRLQQASRLVEPVMIVVVGGIVGYVYAAFLMALMSAGGKF